MELEFIAKGDPRFYDEDLNVNCNYVFRWGPENDETRFFASKLDDGKFMVFQSRKIIFNGDDAKGVYAFIKALKQKRNEDRLLNVEYFFKIWLRSYKLNGIDNAREN